MTRVLITGSTGRLGGAFCSMWQHKASYEISVLRRTDVDLADSQKLRELLLKKDFDVIINPAAMSGLEECLDHPEKAQAVNAHAPRVMAEVCREKNARLVHFSTDYVFSGDTPGKKSETDQPAPINVYGKTKLAGEQAVLNALPSAIIARVSWLFGPAPKQKPTHFDQVIAHAQSGSTKEFIHDKFSIPTYMPDVVDWTETILTNKHCSGIYHLCNSGDPESWHSYAQKACQVARDQGLELPETEFKTLSLSKASFFRDPRPVYTTMTPMRLKEDCGIHPRHWLDAAAEYVKSR